MAPRCWIRTISRNVLYCCFSPCPSSRVRFYKSLLLQRGEEGKTFQLSAHQKPQAKALNSWGPWEWAVPTVPIPVGTAMSQELLNQAVLTLPACPGYSVPSGCLPVHQLGWVTLRGRAGKEMKHLHSPSHPLQEHCTSIFSTSGEEEAILKPAIPSWKSSFKQHCILCIPPRGLLPALAERVVPAPGASSAAAALHGDAGD